MVLIDYNDPILRQKSQPIEKVTPELKQLAIDMYKLMSDNNGAGISAPQIGELIRVIVILDERGNPVFMFNPVILRKSNHKVTEPEGCLSRPGETVEMQRAYEVDVKFRDINNKMQYRKFSGVPARAVQHECEHLDGIVLEFS